MQVVSWRLGGTLSCISVANTNNPHGRIDILSICVVYLPIKVRSEVQTSSGVSICSILFLKTNPGQQYLGTHVVSMVIEKIASSFLSLRINTTGNNVLKPSQRFSVQLRSLGS